MRSPPNAFDPRERFQPRLAPTALVAIIACGLGFLAGWLVAVPPPPPGGRATEHIVLQQGGRTTPTCQVTTTYIPSQLEQAWVNNVKQWENSFCDVLAAHDNSTTAWLKTLRELAQLQQAQAATASAQGQGGSPAQVLAAQNKLTASVFSRFSTAYECPGKARQERVTWIEPLSHGLRHPDALCGRGADLFDRTYLLLAHKSEWDTANSLGNNRCKERKCQAIYFDLGATTMAPTPDEPGQGWFYDAYRKAGITFDRYLLWEAKVQLPSNVFMHVPKADLHKYQYYNIPVSADTADPANPVNMLKAVAQPGDFVAFKLDIDNFAIEASIYKALTTDPEALALVDEFFFEEHVNFPPMIKVGWLGTTDDTKDLAASFDTFYQLRKKGVRAHSWV